MLPGIFLSGFGALLSVWGYVRIKHDFKDNKEINNFFSLLLTGQASGIGQLLSGILAIVVGIVVMFMNK
ncbi:hypothetical protein [Brochothrix thermosphacta]|uniref:Uncharacterized protein n=1 Tax=Brochothrix thermosphacta TaxID=2756 RepID=A0A1D2LYH5_BROTH|nr:hypothetical protein [Brochothrix thermosphacta]ANZ94076.1 hypothetical protein BFC19_00835 [Brochothrix thermosphacta]ATF27072.1 hypothetical protein CNY62_12245 [Brochothrix thermosphacta]ATH86430.1 hypothetical protein CPF12_11930 [Brochothrix thermosphacta]EUJ36085.1 hypothetical protein BTHER_07156 [Brochothrix thermosphacta DSM 20171 = FSL F6-1036]MPQ28007.1 hypothetical protein [Brochothrix thermosphacta]